MKFWRALIILLFIVAIIVGLFRFEVIHWPGSRKIDVSATLTEAVDIAQLSTAEFRYRGIAEIYANEEQKKVQCRACYDAVVKAGIDMRNIQMDIDDANRIVTLTLPEIELTVLINDNEPIALLPSNSNVGIERILKYCKEDVEREARESKELIETAKENLRAIIEGLLLPILKAYDYTLVWN